MCPAQPPNIQSSHPRTQECMTICIQGETKTFKRSIGAPWKWMCPMKMDVPHVNGWAPWMWMDGFRLFLFLGTLDRCWIRFPSRWAPQAQSEAWKIYPWKQPGVVLPRYTSAEGSPRLVRTFFSTGVAQGQMSKKWAPSCARLGAATHASNSVSFLPPHPPVISFESGEQNTHHPKNVASIYSEFSIDCSVYRIHPFFKLEKQIIF